MGLFRQQALKSSLGEENWLRFFALMGSYIAIGERCAPVPDTPSNKAELKRELQKYAKQLNVVYHLNIYGAALTDLEEIGVEGARYFLLELNTAKRTVKITGYKPEEFEKASEDYLKVERAGGLDAVLVSIESIAALRRAYPNYFLDLNRFTQVLNRALR